MSRVEASNPPFKGSGEGPCPYRDLLPFEESHAPYFFGRSSERRLIADNLRASHLTILYGASGAGKTSLLRAGVAARLGEHARRENEQVGSAEYVTTYFKLWQRNSVRELANEIEDSLQAVCGPAGESFEPGDSLARMVSAWRKRYRFSGDFLLILDQFEDFFKYVRYQDGGDGFATELPRLLRDRDLGINILIAIRDDSLTMLDRFKAHIPDLLDNRLQLPHLSREAAVSAMLEPLRVFREQYGEISGPVSLDAALAGEVADEIIGAQQKMSLSEQNLVQAPYLQLVMTRWWRAEKAKESPALNADTLHRELGGVRHIAEGHFAGSVGRLPGELQEVAATAFEAMVTPGGRKIAQTVSELTGKGLNPEQVGAMLAALQQDRIVVTVPPPRGFPDTDRCYEFTHDVIAQAALEWYKDRGRERKARLARAHRRNSFLVGGVVFVLILGIVITSWRFAVSRKESQAARNERFGETQVLQGNYVGALRSYQTALRFFEERGDKPKQLTDLLAITKIYIANRNYGQADSIYSPSYALSQGNPESVGMVLETHASLREQQGKISEALGIYAEAQRNYEDAHDYEGSARVLERLATSAEAGHNFEQAATYYDKALKYYTAAGQPMGVSRTRIGLDRVHRWGFLLDLQELRTYELAGGNVEVGRDVPEINLLNTINLRNRLMSRHHMMLYPSKILEDLRSTNGTTINGRLLPYGDTGKLRDGDIIVAAGIRAFQFLESKPEKIPGRPPDAWGLLVDGPARTAHYLTGGSYSLTFTENRLSLGAGEDSSAPLSFRRVGEQVQVFQRADEWSLVFFPVNKGEPDPSLLRSGVWAELSGVAMQFMQLSADQKSILRRGPECEIVVFEKPRAARAP